jgi:thioredoxin reductase (NADPH)
MSESVVLDLAIIGGGPAGLSAGMYATRGGMKNVVMYEKGLLGGQITKSSEIENYPGMTEVVSGLELMEKWPEQVMRFGLRHEMTEVIRVAKSGKLFELTLEGGEIARAKSVLVCTGANPKKIGVKGEDEFYGRGVSYCATCDGFFYRGKEVAVLGGGDSALEEAIFLSNICSKVYLIHRRDEFRASPSTVERVRKNPKIECVMNAVVEEIRGDMMAGVQGVEVSDKTTGERRVIDAPGVFVFVGMNVNNKVLSDESGNFICEMSPNGEVIVDLRMRTSVHGLFAAGDIRIQAAKQVVCAAADGAVAAIEAISYLEELED